MKNKYIAIDNTFHFGKKCIGSIICTPLFRMWFQTHQGVFLLYPLGPLINYMNAETAFLYFVYIYE